MIYARYKKIEIYLRHESIVCCDYDCYGVPLSLPVIPLPVQHDQSPSWPSSFQCGLSPAFHTSSFLATILSFCRLSLGLFGRSDWKGHIIILFVWSLVSRSFSIRSICLCRSVSCPLISISYRGRSGARPNNYKLSFILLRISRDNVRNLNRVSWKQ